MYKLSRAQTYLLGKFAWNGTQYVANSDAHLIRKVVASNCLEQVGVNAWGVAFQDRDDGRFWVRREYLSLVGPGPEILHCVPEISFQALFHREWSDIDIFNLRERMYQRVIPVKAENFLCGICYNSPIYDGIRDKRDKIEWLVNVVFDKLAMLDNEALYWDASNDCYWEYVLVDYARDALGGGHKALAENPCFLHQIDRKTAIRKYNSPTIPL